MAGFKISSRSRRNNNESSPPEILQFHFSKHSLLSLSLHHGSPNRIRTNETHELSKPILLQIKTFLSFLHPFFRSNGFAKINDFRERREDASWRSSRRAGVARGRTPERASIASSRSCAPDKRDRGYTMGFIVRPASKQRTALCDSRVPPPRVIDAAGIANLFCLSREL